MPPVVLPVDIFLRLAAGSLTLSSELSDSSAVRRALVGDAGVEVPAQTESPRITLTSSFLVGGEVEMVQWETMTEVDTTEVEESEK